MKLDKRQKILIPLIVIAFIYIGWQVYDIFFVAESTSAAATSQQITLAKTVTMPPAAKPVITQQPQVPAAAPTPAKQPGAPEKKSIADISVTSGQSDAYVKLMREYQTLETQRMLLQEKVAIAEMKQKISDLNAKLGQLPSVATEVSKTTEGPGYKLIYLDHQQGQWAATLADRNNVFREVSAGSDLGDGYKVIAVTSKGVVIEKDGEAMRLTFSGVMPLQVIPKLTPIMTKPKYKVVPKPVVKQKQPIVTKPTVKRPAVTKPVAPKPVAPKPNKKPVTQLTPKVSAVVKPKAVVPNYTLQKAKPVPVAAATPQKKSSATVVELAPVAKAKAPVVASTAPKKLVPNYTIKPVTTKKPVNLNYNVLPKPEKVVAKTKKPKTTNNPNHIVVTQLLPQPAPVKTAQKKTAQNNSDPIIMMN